LSGFKTRSCGLQEIILCMNVTNSTNVLLKFIRAVRVRNVNSFVREFVSTEKNFVDDRRDVFAETLAENEIGTVAVGENASFAGFQIHAVNFL